MIPPPEFVCPLTNEVMNEPMVSRHGIRFEKKAIMRWLNEGNTFCPVTRNPLRVSNLVSDKNFQWKIRYWAEKHGYSSNFISNDNSVVESYGIILTASIPPSKFICPLTKDIMTEPMMSRYGSNFEKTEILRRLDRNGYTCPLSGKPLRPSDLVSNHKLQWEIKQWNLQYGQAYYDEVQAETKSKLAKATMISQGHQTSDIIKALANEDFDFSTTTETATESSKSTEEVLSCLDEIIDTIG